MPRKTIAKKYLVTGGCGFIGSHLVDALIANGHDVIVLDNLTTGKISNLSKKAILIVGDIRDTKLLPKLMRRVDGCFHLAAIVSIVKAHHDWLKTHEINLSGTINVFNAARQGRYGKPIPVIYASSCAVYGESKKLPLTEMSLIRPISAYGADKLACELHANVATKIFGVPTTGLRLFNIYGTRQDPSSPYSGVVTIFLNKLEGRQSIKIFGDGKQTRDFVYVKDAVRFLIASMNHQKRDDANVYNVCTGKAISINQLEAVLGKILHTIPKIIYTNSRPGDVIHSRGNPSNSFRFLKIKTKYKLQEGLSEMINEL